MVVIHNQILIPKILICLVSLMLNWFCENKMQHQCQCHQHFFFLFFLMFLYYYIFKTLYFIILFLPAFLCNTLCCLCAALNIYKCNCDYTIAKRIWTFKTLKNVRFSLHKKLNIKLHLHTNNVRPFLRANFTFLSHLFLTN